MDRHQFVESLINKRDELIDTVEEQEKQNKILYQRSKTYLRELLKEPEHKEGFVSTGTYLSSQVAKTLGAWNGYNGGVTGSPPSKDIYNSVSDEDIITLCIEIGKLRDRVDELFNKNEKLKQEDVSGFIKELIND